MPNCDLPQKFKQQGNLATLKPKIVYSKVILASLAISFILWLFDAPPILHPRWSSQNKNTPKTVQKVSPSIFPSYHATLDADANQDSCQPMDATITDKKMEGCIWFRHLSTIAEYLE